MLHFQIVSYHQCDICKEVTELCELCYGVARYEIVKTTDICSLLEIVCTNSDSFILWFILLIYLTLLL